VITVKEELTIEDEIKIIEVMQFQAVRPWLHLVTNAKAQCVEFKKPFILHSEKKISLLQDIPPSLETVAQACRSRIIITENREALAACIANKLSGQVIFTKGSVFGDNRESIQASFADYGQFYVSFWEYPFSNFTDRCCCIPFVLDYNSCSKATSWRSSIAHPILIVSFQRCVFCFRPARPIGALYIHYDPAL